MLSADPDIRRLMALRAIEGGLLRLKWLAAATRFEIAMRRHDRALKANFNPNQPRVPRGNPDGGQWTSGGGNGQKPTNGGEPKTPEEKPPKSRDRTAVLKTIARRILEAGETAVNIAKLSAWIRTYSPTIESYNDPPRSLDEPQRAAATPLPGYDVHHIVQQNQKGVFGTELIESPENKLLIPRMKHWDINKWYQTENPNFGGKTPQQYVNGRNWKVQREVGLEALRINGVLKP